MASPRRRHWLPRVHSCVFSTSWSSPSRPLLYPTSKCRHLQASAQGPPSFFSLYILSLVIEFIPFTLNTVLGPWTAPPTAQPAHISPMNFRLGSPLAYSSPFRCSHTPRNTHIQKAIHGHYPSSLFLLQPI